jgi:hypothetical protein
MDGQRHEVHVAERLDPLVRDEDIRLLTHERLRTMAVAVIASAYFSCVFWVGRPD